MRDKARLLAIACAVPLLAGLLSGCVIRPVADRPVPTPTELTLAEQAASLPAPELAPQVDVASVGATATPQTAMATALLLEVKGARTQDGVHP